MAAVGWAVDADGDWGNKLDWSTGRFPGGTDDVLLSTEHAHTITHSTGADAVGSLTATNDTLAVSGGSLRVIGTASLGASLVLSGGTMVLGGGGGISGGVTATGGVLALGNGTTTSISGAVSLGDQTSLTGPGTLATAGTTTVGGDGSNVLMGGNITWRNSGTALLVGGVQTVSTTHFVNGAGSLFNLSGDGADIVSNGGGSTFSNIGALAKTGGNGTSEIDSALTSTGTINVASGTLLLTTGGTIGGTLNGAGTLQLGSGSTTKLATLSGSGQILSTGMLQLAGSTATLGVGLMQAGGTLSLVTGATLTASSSLDLRDGAVVTGNGALAMKGATNVGADGTAIYLRGGMKWDNSGTVAAGGGILTLNASTFINEAGARFALTTDGAGIITDGGGSTFSNAGTLAKAGGSGTSEIDSALTSTGTINVASGTLLLTTGGTIGGTLNGPGTLQLGSGSTTKLATLSGSGQILSTGMLQLAGSTATLGVGLMQAGGTLSLATGATLTASSSLDLRDGAVVTGNGALATKGATNVGADGTAIYLRGGMKWDNSGSVAGGGGILTLNASTFINEAGASFALTTDGAGIIADGGGSTFSNAGTLAKTGGSGTSEIDSALTSTGTINVASGTLLLTTTANLAGALTGPGTLELSATGNHVTGLIASASSTLSFLSGAGVMLAGSVLGQLELTQASLAVSGSSDRVVGAFAQSGGSIYVTDQLTLALNGDATIGGGVAISGLGTLSTAGATIMGGDGAAISLSHLTWVNRGQVTLDSSATLDGNAGLINASGTEFDFGGDSGNIRVAAGKSAFSNAGTLAKLAGNGTSVVDAFLTSTGTILANTGTLDLDGGGTINGSVAGSGTLLFGGGSFSVAASAAISVATVAVNGAAVTLGGGLASSLSVQAGSLSIGGALTTATLSATGGTLTLLGASNTSAALALQSATLVLGPTAGLAVSGSATLSGGGTISGPGTFATSGATSIANGGTAFSLANGVSWSNLGSVYAAGAIQCAGAAAISITNAAAAAFNLDSDLADILDGSTPSSFTNLGTLAKLAGNGTSIIDSTLTSTGTITVAMGTLDLDGGGAIRGSVGGTGTLRLGGGSFSIAGSTAFTVANFAVSAGSVTLGTTSVPANFEIAGAFSLTSGSVTLATGGSLTLDGAASFAGGGSIGGAGTLNTSGPATLGANGSAASFSDGLVWNNSGIVTVLGQICSGGLTPVTFNNAAGGTFNLGNDVAGVFETGSLGTFNNAGTLAKTGGNGTSTLYCSVNSTGTLVASSGTLALAFGPSLAGVAGGTNGGLLRLVSGATSAGQLAITDNGNTASVQLDSYYASWTNSGTVADGGQVQLGNGGGGSPAILYNASGAAWDMTTDDGGIIANGTVWFTNAGTLAKTGGSGTSAVALGFANSGLIDAASGTLRLQGVVSGIGQMRVEAGSTLELGRALGSGQTLTMAGSGATLKLDQPASVAGPILGLSAGDSIDLAGTGVTGATVAGNVLSVSAGGNNYTFTSSQSLDGLQAQVTGDGSGGSLVTLMPASLGLSSPRFLAAGGTAPAADLLPGGVQHAAASARLADLVPALSPVASGAWAVPPGPLGAGDALGLWPTPDRAAAMHWVSLPHH